MDVKITPRKLGGTIEAISSKSHAHRLYLASALARLYDTEDRPTKVMINTNSEDIEATRKCLAQLKLASPIFNCGESGSTLRFLLPVAMAMRENAVFLGTGSLPNRPMEPLTNEMTGHGCQFYSSLKTPPQGLTEIFSVKGKLQPGKFYMPGNISSQFITGLLFALPLLEGDSELQITTPLESASYVSMTLKVLLEFGINLQLSSTSSLNYDEKLPVARIKGNQIYSAPSERVYVEGDWTNAAVWLAAGAMQSPTTSSSMDAEIKCTGISYTSLQGDKEIVELIRRFGGIVSYGLKSVTVSEGTMNAIPEIDVSDIPDLVPILSVLAATSTGLTRITNASRLRLKESDRILAMRDCLRALGVNVEELPDGLVIHGRGYLTGGVVDSFNDHRIAMAMALASISCKEPLTIKHAEAVKKSYPDFFEDFKALGGAVDGI